MQHPTHTRALHSKASCLGSHPGATRVLGELLGELGGLGWSPAPVCPRDTAIGPEVQLGVVQVPGAVGVFIFVFFIYFSRGV